ncbi:MAG: hypothetical protein JWM73_1745 [Solirubrobacterales bacterium]|nr:hypothetical protein [Solirubrobacterales bacterium]
MSELDDAPRGGGANGFSDALTYAFSDPGGDVCGVARLGLAEGGASGLVLVFRGGEPAAVKADGEGTAGPAWEQVSAAGLTTETLEPGRRWRVRFDGDVPFDLEFAAVGVPFVLPPESPAAEAGGMEGFDHVCRVSGTVGGEPFDGRGQRGRSWGAPDWDKMLLARTLSAWFDDEHALSAVSIRPAKASSHADERSTVLLLAGEEAREVAEPRLSTTYDAEERQRAAGLELYVDADDEFAARVAGEVVAGTSLDLGRLRLDCAFFRWRMQGREGVGRYDVLRRLG